MELTRLQVYPRSADIPFMKTKDGNERRFEGRFMCADLVRVNWCVNGHQERSAEGVLEDISPLGACVQVEEKIPLGTPISIFASKPGEPTEPTFVGSVSYCVYRDYGFFVGIRLSAETRWSAGAFEPQHLTSLSNMGDANPDLQ